MLNKTQSSVLRAIAENRIADDDVTAVQNMLAEFTPAQISEFITLAAEKNAANVTALLLDYNNKTFAHYDPMDIFTLDLL